MLYFRKSNGFINDGLRQIGPLLILIIIICGLSSFNLFSGIAEDVDGTFVVAKALEFSVKGYQRSRSWGFPAYELIIYPLISTFGAFSAKLYALFLTVCAITTYYFLLFSIKSSRVKAFLGALCFSLSPLTIIASNTTLGTSQEIFFVISGLWAFVQWGKHRSLQYLLLVSAGFGLATSSRPDHILISTAVGLIILIFYRPSVKKILLAVGVWVTFAVLPFFIYQSFYFGLDVVYSFPLIQRIGRAFIGLIAIWGIPFWLLIAWWLFFYRRDISAKFHNKKFEIKPYSLLVIISLLLYLVRFVLLPDELEYIYIFIPLIISLFVFLNITSKNLVILLLAMLIPNLLQPYLFQRSLDGNLILSLGFSPGAIFQDHQNRLRMEYETEIFPITAVKFAEQQGCKNVSTLLFPQSYPIQGPICSFLPEDRIRFYEPGLYGGMEKFQQVICSQRIFVFPLPTHRAWRQMIKFENWTPVESNDFYEMDYQKIFGISCGTE